MLTLALAAAIAGNAQKLECRTTWVGNTFSGGPKWVQNFIEGVAVREDGLVVCASTWDEAGREYGLYRDGDVVGMCADTHGWGELGGSAAAFGRKYLFIAMTHGNEGGHLTGKAYPPRGLTWICVSRRTHDGDHAPFAGGRGRFNDQFVLHELPENLAAPVHGLAADREGNLYVSDSPAACIRVLDEETMQEVRRIPAIRPRQLAVDPSGLLWALHAPDPQAPMSELLRPERDETQWRAVRYARDGRPNRTIWFARGISPTSLCFDGHGRLYVTDNGPAQQVLVFGRPAASDAVAGTLGVRGGVYTRPVPGRTGPDRFCRPMGVGVDGQGRVVVGCNTPAGGAVLRAFAPWRPGRKPEMLWELLGLEFVDCGDVDRGDGSDGAHVYTTEGHYEVDWDAEPGKHWRWVGFSLDPFRYPEDLRLHEGHHGLAGALIRRLQGRRFLVVRGMFQHFLAIYRYNGEIAIPSVVFSRGHYRHGDWTPPGQPEKGSWMWRDLNGNGRMEAGEYLDVTEQNDPEFWAWWMDEAGGVWRGEQTGEKPIRYYPLLGLDRHGNPLYSLKQARSFDLPVPMNHLLRIQYEAASDTMYLSGHTSERPKTGSEWGQVGSEILRFDGWLRGSPKLRYRIALPYEPRNDVGQDVVVKAMCVEADAVFAVELRSAKVHVFDANTGAKLGEMTPGPEVHGESGWVDFPDAIRAYRRKNGEYLVFVEEDWKGKLIVYRWRPR